jgi:AcrR family transcriptional regulator
MTKTSSRASNSGHGNARAAVGVTCDQAVAAALELLDETGLENLSLRRVADRLGVRINTVQWHVGDKASLLKAMADSLMRECLREPLPEGPQDRIRVLIRRFRQTLLSRRDGGRLAADGFSFSDPSTLAFAEAFTATLLETGRTPRAVAWTGWTLLYFTLGLVQEEQSAPGRSPGMQAGNIDLVGFPALAQTLPLLTDSGYDARFEYGIELILSGPWAQTGKS